MTAITVSLNKRVSFLLAGACFYILVLTGFLYHNVLLIKEDIADGYDSKLEASASLIPLILGDDYHDVAVNEASLSEDEEFVINRKLGLAAQNTGASFLYTVIEHSGSFYLTSASVDESFKPGSERRFFYRYQDMPQPLINSLKNGVKTFTNSKDPTGGFRTAAIPFKSASGRQYLACADISLLKIDQSIENVIIKAVLLWAFLIILVLPIFYLVFYYYVRLARVNEQLTRDRSDLELTTATRTIELEKVRDDLLKNREQLLLALQTGKISIFKWDLKNEKIDFTQNIIPGLESLKRKCLSIRFFRRMLHKEDRDNVMAKLARYVSGSADDFNVDCRLRIDRENYLWFHVIGKIVERSATGIGLFMVGIMEDITEIKAREASLQQSQKLEAVGQLAGGIAHDFNNMLQAIIGYAEMIKLSITEEDENFSVIELLIQAAMKSQALVRQLLTFSRMSQETRENLDLNKALAELVKMLKRLMGDHIELATDFAEKLPYVVGNMGQLEQVILNLCVNSRDAIAKDGRITISTKETTIDESLCSENSWARAGHFVVVTVADNGPGIPVENRKKIFEPFFTTKGVGKGTGLGLAIVYGVVQKHEGFINLVSEIGVGTEFQIYLPVSRMIEEIKSKGGAADDQNLEGTETILLAEDAELVRNFAGRMLRKAGYKVIFACDGQEAVELFDKHKDEIDILVFDIVMPRMTGKVAYEQIKKIKSYVPVVFCSGYHEEILDTGFYSNFNGTFLPKPYKTKDLLLRIRSLLDKPVKTGADYAG